MSCQPHRVTSGQSNSGHKQMHIFKLFSHISTLCQVNLQNQSLHKHKTYIHKHQTHIFQELLVSSTIPSNLSIPDYRKKKRKKKKEWTDTIGNFKMSYKCIMANTSAIWQQAAHTTYQQPSPSCSTRAIQKSLTPNEKYLRVSGGKKVRTISR